MSEVVAKREEAEALRAMLEKKQQEEQEGRRRRRRGDPEPEPEEIMKPQDLEEQP